VWKISTPPRFDTRIFQPVASRCKDYVIPAYLLQHIKSDRKSPKVVTKEGETISSVRRHDETSSGAISPYPLTGGGTAVQGKAAAESSGSLRYLIKHYTFTKFQEVWGGGKGAVKGKI